LGNGKQRRPSERKKARAEGGISLLHRVRRREANSSSRISGRKESNLPPTNRKKARSTEGGVFADIGGKTEGLTHQMPKENDQTINISQ